MRRSFHAGPVPTEETARATSFEIFFDLVFVFALIRVTLLMGSPPTPLAMAHGLLLLMLLWISWSNYIWLGNQARADVGIIRVGTLVAMAAIFVAALVIPSAWAHDFRKLDGPLTLALAYVTLTGLQLLLYFYSAMRNRRLRTTVGLFAIVEILSWVPLVTGAFLGGTAQTLLWAASFLITFLGGFFASILSGWQLRSASHFTERHDLVMIIVLGESLISVGMGVGQAVDRAPELVAALLAFTITTCLWWLYFERVGRVAGRTLARQSQERRSQVATNAYSLAHFPLIAGVIYLALGVEEVLVDLSRAGQQRLPWTTITALYGGSVLYLVGRAVFRRIATGSSPPGQLVAVGVTLLLIPVARTLPALAALGLLAAILIALACYERFSATEPAVVA
jgi:low temperature requirement protein LtrA